MKTTATDKNDKFYPLSYVDKVINAYLTKLGLAASTAKSVSDALLWAQARGLPSHGLERIPAYSGQYKKGKINRTSSLKFISLDDSAFVVDADFGFAYPAIDLAVKELYRRCQQQTTCVVGIKNSHHAGALGYYVEQLASQGIIALICCNAPASIAPWGGKKPLLGTNPIAFGCPRAGVRAGTKGKKTQQPLIIDMSLSVVARGKVMAADFKGEEIPLGWALDKVGNPTTDAKKALEGSMLPIGGAKGYLLALVVEILAAALIGNNFSYQSSSFFDDVGKPPGVGQFILAINPLRINPDFNLHIEGLCAAIMQQPGTRLPGVNKNKDFSKSRKQGVAVSVRMQDYLGL